MEPTRIPGELDGADVIADPPVPRSWWPGPLWVRDALKTMDIRLLDHIIVADDDFVSMNQSGYLV